MVKTLCHWHSATNPMFVRIAPDRNITALYCRIVFCGSSRVARLRYVRDRKASDFTYWRRFWLEPEHKAAVHQVNAFAPEKRNTNLAVKAPWLARRAI